MAYLWTICCIWAPDVDRLASISCFLGQKRHCRVEKWLILGENAAKMPWTWADWSISAGFRAERRHCRGEICHLGSRLQRKDLDLGHFWRNRWTFGPKKAAMPHWKKPFVVRLLLKAVEWETSVGFRWLFVSKSGAAAGKRLNLQAHVVQKTLKKPPWLGHTFRGRLGLRAL